MSASGWLVSLLAAGTAVASADPHSPGSQTEGEREAPHRRPVWACSPQGRPPPRVRGAARPPVRRHRETVTATARALPPPREPRDRRDQLTKAERACARAHPRRSPARPPPGTRWRSLPRPRSRGRCRCVRPKRLQFPSCNARPRHTHALGCWGRGPPSGSRCMLGVVVLKAASPALRRRGSVLSLWKHPIPASLHARSPCELLSARCLWRCERVGRWCVSAPRSCTGLRVFP